MEIRFVKINESETAPVVYRATYCSAEVKVVSRKKNFLVEFSLMGDLVATFTFGDKASAIIFAENLISRIDVI